MGRGSAGRGCTNARRGRPQRVRAPEAWRGAGAGGGARSPRSRLRPGAASVAVGFRRPRLPCALFPPVRCRDLSKGLRAQPPPALGGLWAAGRSSPQEGEAGRGPGAAAAAGLPILEAHQSAAFFRPRKESQTKRAHATAQKYSVKFLFAWLAYFLRARVRGCLRICILSVGCFVACWLWSLKQNP